MSNGMGEMRKVEDGGEMSGVQMLQGIPARRSQVWDEIDHPFTPLTYSASILAFLSFLLNCSQQMTNW